MGHDRRDEYQKELDRLENELERLRRLYEQYFMGIEKVPPELVRSKVARQIRNSPLDKVRSTVVKFRFRGIAQKLASYSAYWDRVGQMLEAGTFRRDRVRNPMADHGVLRRRRKRIRGDEMAPATPPAPTPTPTPTPAPTPARPAPAPVSAAPPQRAAASAAPPLPPAAKTTKRERPELRPLPEERLRSLFDTYVSARQANGEPTDRVSYAGFRRSVLETRTAHLSRMQCEDLDYKVKLRNGRVSLVAKPVR